MSSAQDRDGDEAVIVRAVLRLARRLRQSVPASELTGGALGLVAALHRGGPMSAASLARSEGLQPQSLSRLLARLERQAFIERGVDPADRRRQVIEVTRSGLGALDRAIAHRRSWLAEAMADRLDEAERAELLRAAALMLRIAG
jgi:DNA-binding MarR family transcriptional regulator